MNIKVTISGVVDDPYYPLSGLSDLLYKALDFLNAVESRGTEEVKFPIVKKFKDEGNHIELKLEKL